PKPLTMVMPGTETVGGGNLGSAGGAMEPSRPTTIVGTRRTPVSLELSWVLARAEPLVLLPLKLSAPRRPISLLSECANWRPPGSSGCDFAGRESALMTGGVPLAVGPMMILYP